MNKDRGMKKWNAMMLPEHVNLIQEWKKEDDLDKRPEVDEWLLQQYAEHIELAWISRKPVRISCWLHGKRTSYEGVIMEMHPVDHSIILQSTDYSQYKIETATIYEVNLLEWSVE